MNKKLVVAGRVGFALGLIGLGIQQFLYPGFRPVFVPVWPTTWFSEQPLVYLLSAVLIFTGISIIFKIRARETSVICGCVFLVMFVFLHIPFQMQENPGALGAWTDAFKILAFSGIAFIVANSFNRRGKSVEVINALERLLPFGRFFFGLMLLVFGIDHFLYAQGVATLVPSWIPGSLFWTYLAGIALIGAGSLIIINVQLRLMSILTGIMIFIWFLILHIPRAIAMPDLLNGNEVTSVMQALAFSGGSFVLAFTEGEKGLVAKKQFASAEVQS
jgi:uncharacterized membrane protein YphA (DoxX/SURF4 family)